MDCLASGKEAARAQLTLVEIQFRAAKERAEVQTKKVEELQSRLGSAISDRESLDKELKTAMEILEEVQAWGFDLSVEIKDTKVLEAEAKKLAYPEEEDFEDSSGSEGGENLGNPGDEAGSGQDQAA
ncbi:uncharacterized protein [Nicotiana tomentosiformis]|uniref:uncharacterized protein n=1 Tax=Nicotiana tomentosiformis TaxID=4098 RepID=UPI00051AB1BB|nr:uncharacterized protein LOC104106670 [Nicotiana tomentosiformis]